MMRKIHWVVLTALLLFPVAAFWFYPQMPDPMVTQWGFNGEPNDYMSKFVGTFGIAMVLMIFPTMGLSISVAVSKNLKYEAASKPMLIFGSILVIMTIFLLTIYTSTLIWNAGHHFSMNLFVGITIPALFISIPGSIIYILSRKEDSLPGYITGGQITADGYKDKLIEITKDQIIFNDYYFPMGNKTVELSQVDSVEEKIPTIWNGQWRLHGGGLGIWFPADYSRPKRDKIFVMKLKDKLMRIGFTVENSQAVSEIFKSRNLIKN